MKFAEIGWILAVVMIYTAYFVTGEIMLIAAGVTDGDSSWWRVSRSLVAGAAVLLTVATVLLLDRTLRRRR